MFGLNFLKSILEPKQRQKIHVFDFDGTLASPFDDCLFSLPLNSWDAAFVDEVSDRMKLDLSSQPLVHQRYACQQALLGALGMDIQPWMLLNTARREPFIIMTARSEYYSLLRMFTFVNKQKIRPLKVLALAGTPKGAAMASLLEEIPDVDFSFWDDKKSCLASVEALDSPRISTTWVDNSNSEDAMKTEAFNCYTKSMVEYLKNSQPSL